jgi:uncharacterized Fe-S cluster-containing MiaB family protein
MKNSEPAPNPDRPLDEGYPALPAERDRWILRHRPVRNAVDPQRPYAFLIEQECAANGEPVDIATIFLTNRECPWRCLMCDLWKNTLTESIPTGAIPAQIDFALARLAGTRSAASVTCSSDAMERVPTRLRQIKLYNNGSFFDPRAIPPGDFPAIAQRLAPFERVVVECHPALVGESALRFQDLLAAADVGPLEKGEASARPPSHVGGCHRRLEVAMGLETAHPQVLEKLNKRMTLDQYAQAAEFLSQHGIALRAFVLVKPPFLDDAQALEWSRRSIDFAFDCGATVVSLIPTRPGNGALEALTDRVEFSTPKLATLEAALDYGIRLKRGRVFADLWDLEEFSGCPACFLARKERLGMMNLRQVLLPPVSCEGCGDAGLLRPARS